jgi:hypothetical protein
LPNENTHFRGVQVRRSVAAAIAWLAVVFLWISPTISLAGEEGWLRIGGLSFGDVYRVLSHHTEQGIRPETDFHLRVTFSSTWSEM